MYSLVYVRLGVKPFTRLFCVLLPPRYQDTMCVYLCVGEGVYVGVLEAVGRWVGLFCIRENCSRTPFYYTHYTCAHTYFV